MIPSLWVKRFTLLIHFAGSVSTMLDTETSQTVGNLYVVYKCMCFEMTHGFNMRYWVSISIQLYLQTVLKKLWENERCIYMLDYFSWHVISLYYIIVCAFKHWGTSCCTLLLHCLIKSYDSRTNPDVSGPSQVCASDGRSHANYAAMVVDGCRRNKTVEVSYKGYCKSTCLLPSLPSVHAWLCLLCADVYVCLYTALKLLSSK